MLRELMLRCANDFSDGLSTFQCLVKMQHYSLPTRLLDLTSNPLVALYFACAIHDHDDEDGEVIVLRFDIDELKYFDSDTVCVLANLSRQPPDFRYPTEKNLKKFNQLQEIKLLLHNIRRDKPYFEPHIRPDDLGKVICVKPLLDNPRIIRQDGAFLLFGMDRQPRTEAQLPKKAVIGRIKINRDKKKELTSQLETLGVSQATMFPEIEQVASHIKEKYKNPELERLRTLSDTQFDVMKRLAMGRPFSVNEIATQMELAASLVSREIGRLNEYGFLYKIGYGRSVRWEAIDAVRHWFQRQQLV